MKNGSSKHYLLISEAEYVGDWRRGGVLFYRFMLQDLQNCIWNLDPLESFGEIRSFEKPLHLVHRILKSVLLILYPQWSGTDEIENWNCCLEVRNLKSTNVGKKQFNILKRCPEVTGQG